MDPCSYEHCFWKQDTSLLTRRFRVTPYGISCINIEIIKGHIYVSFVMYLYHKNDMASKAAQHIQKNYCIFWQFQMIFFWQKQQCLPWIVSVLDEFSSAWVASFPFSSRVPVKGWRTWKFKTFWGIIDQYCEKVWFCIQWLTYEIYTYVCICQDLFVNMKVVELRLKAPLIDQKKIEFAPSFMFMLWHIWVLPIF